MRSSVQAQTRGRRSRREVEEEETRGFPGSAFLAAAGQLAARRPLDTVAFTFATFSCLAILINALFLQSGLHPAPLIPFKPRPVAQVAPKETPLRETTLRETTGATSAIDTVMPRPRPSDSLRAPAVAAVPVALAPAAADTKKSELVVEIQKELARRGRYDGTADGIWGPKTIAASRDFVQHAHAKVAVEPNELLLRAIVRTPAKIPATSTPANAPIPLPPAPVAAAPVIPVRSAPVEAIAPPAPVPLSTGNRRLMNAQRALSDFGYGQIKPTGTDDAATRAAIQAFERERNLPVTGRLSDAVAKELSTTTGRALD